MIEDISVPHFMTINPIDVDTFHFKTTNVNVLVVLGENSR